MTLAAAALTAMPVDSASANKGGGGNANYEYEVKGWSHEVSGQLAGSTSFPVPCVPQKTSAWSAAVSGAQADETLVNGDGKLHIGRHGTEGKIVASQAIRYDMRNATYGVATQCGPGGPKTVATRTCSDSRESSQKVVLDVSGGVGNKLKLGWSFGAKGGNRNAPQLWIPSVFGCGAKSFYFGFDSSCKTKSSLGQFTGRNVRVSYICAWQDSSGGQFTGVQVNGEIAMKRTGHD